MINVTYAQKFIKNYQRITKKNKEMCNAYEKFIKKFQKDPFSNGLKTHTINLSLGKVYSSRVTGDIRILWEFVNEKEVSFANTGRHSGSHSIYK